MRGGEWRRRRRRWRGSRRSGPRLSGKCSQRRLSKGRPRLSGNHSLSHNGSRRVHHASVHCQGISTLSRHHPSLNPLSCRTRGRARHRYRRISSLPRRSRTAQRPSTRRHAPTSRSVATLHPRLLRSRRGRHSTCGPTACSFSRSTSSSHHNSSIGCRRPLTTRKHRSRRTRRSPISKLQRLCLDNRNRTEARRRPRRTLSPRSPYQRHLLSTFTHRQQQRAGLRRRRPTSRPLTPRLRKADSVRTGHSSGKTSDRTQLPLSRRIGRRVALQKMSICLGLTTRSRHQRRPGSLGSTRISAVRAQRPLVLPRCRSRGRARALSQLRRCRCTAAPLHLHFLRGSQHHRLRRHQNHQCSFPPRLSD